MDCERSGGAPAPIRLRRLVLAAAMASFVTWSPHALAEGPERESTGMMVSGIVLTVLGAVSLGAAITAMVAETQQSSESCPGCLLLVGAAQSTVTAHFLGLGIPFWLVGASERDSTGARSGIYF